MNTVYHDRTYEAWWSYKQRLGLINPVRHLYNEMFRGCFTVVERKNIKKLMINGELVIEWKKEKSIKDVVMENICYD